MYIYILYVYIHKERYIGRYIDKIVAVSANNVG